MVDPACPSTFSSLIRKEKSFDGKKTRPWSMVTVPGHSAVGCTTQASDNLAQKRHVAKASREGSKLSKILGVFFLTAQCSSPKPRFWPHQNRLLVTPVKNRSISSIYLCFLSCINELAELFSSDSDLTQVVRNFGKLVDDFVIQGQEAQREAQSRTSWIR
jgi:hypothetical protein